MSITPQKKEESQKFITALNTLLEFIEKALPFINENDYLIAMNSLKTLNDNREQISITHITQIIQSVRTNPVVITHNKRRGMKIKTNHEHLTDADKLKKGWKICPKCNRLLMDLDEHQRTDVCKRTTDTKKMSAKVGSSITTKYTNIVYKIRAWLIKNKWRGGRIAWLFNKL